eukprot:CAMPEP_0116030308 /NCGR_PEP_ID=MMETSP0321-20121206/16776_1 /TAXON_ID=163516 /ORGANISM="Leptocylindrus danicus var. danicus, Strain B650" /LENGTH=427 /DNA_ID=CAMNT_0003505087 /DNA_START=38 /DNA_END=1321 /DNA_ORIENTATION=-
MLKWATKEEDILVSDKVLHLLIKEERGANPSDYHEFDSFFNKMSKRGSEASVNNANNGESHLPQYSSQAMGWENGVNTTRSIMQNRDVSTATLSKARETSAPCEHAHLRSSGSAAKKGGNYVDVIYPNLGNPLHVLWHQSAASFNSSPNNPHQPFPFRPQPTTFDAAAQTYARDDHNNFSSTSEASRLGLMKNQDTKFPVKVNFRTTFVNSSFISSRSTCSKNIIMMNNMNCSASEAAKLLLVDHTYFDFSLVEDKVLLFRGATAVGQSLKSVLRDEPQSIWNMIEVSSQLKRNILTFPMKLMILLSSLDVSEISDGIKWLPHGRSFIVLDPKKFEKDIMPKYFGHLRLFKSFLRQVNLWGFKRITHGADRGAYYHQLFLRKKPGLTRMMELVKAQERGRLKGIKPLPNPQAEPNFYDLAEKRPLPS